MEIEEVMFELELAGLNGEQCRKIMMSIQRGGFDAKEVDKKLGLMGFDPIFTDEYEEDEAEKKN